MEGISQGSTGGFLQPEKVVQQLNIRPNIQVADFGCGHGYFTIVIAKLLGAGGKIYAIDILKEALEAVDSQAKLENLSNIQFIRANLEVVGSSTLGNNSMDLVLMANILFQSQQKSNILKEAQRVLKEGGMLFIIEWVPDASKIGPQEQSWRLDADKMKQLVENEGFEFERNIEAGSFHYGLVFKK